MQLFRYQGRLVIRAARYSHQQAALHTDAFPGRIKAGMIRHIDDVFMKRKV